MPRKKKEPVESPFIDPNSHDAQHVVLPGRPKPFPEPIPALVPASVEKTAQKEPAGGTDPAPVREDHGRKDGKKRGDVPAAPVSSGVVPPSGVSAPAKSGTSTEALGRPLISFTISQGSVRGIQKFSTDSIEKTLEWLGTFGVSPEGWVKKEKKA